MISVIIPTYKKKEQLIRNLRHNLPHLAGCEVIVVNDDPSESLEQDLKEFGEVKLLENKENLGFAGSVNRGIRASSRPLVFLLNSDVLIHDRSFFTAAKKFEEHPGLFAIAFAQKEKDGMVAGRNRLFWQSGMIRHSRAKSFGEGITAWAEGGSSVFRKVILEELAFFDTLYSPFYWEDIDLSYRAWRAGYEILFDPTVTVTHHHESTIGALFAKDKVKTVSYRNQFTFIWKNIHDPSLLAGHVLLLPKNAVHALLAGESSFFKGLIAALVRLPSILAHRHQKNYPPKRNDRTVLRFFENL